MIAKQYAKEAAQKGGVFRNRAIMAVTFLTGLTMSANLGKFQAFMSSMISEFDHEEDIAKANLDIESGEQNKENNFAEVNKEQALQTPSNSIGIKKNVASDDMSFGEAFSISREELGAGNVFEWKGTLYNTYYKEEFAELSDADKNEFAEAVKNLDANIAESVSVDVVDCQVVKNINFTEEELGSEILLGEEYLELDNGEDIKVALFSKNGENYSKIDVNNNGTYDFEYSELNDSFFKGINGMEDLSLENISSIDKGDLISTDVTEIDGHISIIKTYADNSQEVITDIDGDGSFEFVLDIDKDGTLAKNTLSPDDPDDPYKDDPDDPNDIGEIDDLDFF